MPMGQVVADISPAPIFLPESFANNFAILQGHHEHLV